MSDAVMVACITVLGGIATAIINKVIGKNTEVMAEIKKEVAETKAIAIENKAGNREITAFRLLEDMEQALKQGYTSVSKFHSLTDLYHGYKSRGGNGRVEATYKKYEQLDIRED